MHIMGKRKNESAAHDGYVLGLPNCYNTHVKDKTRDIPG